MTLIVMNLELGNSKLVLFMNVIHLGGHSKTTLTIRGGGIPVNMAFKALLHPSPLDPDSGLTPPLGGLKCLEEGFQGSLKLKH